MEDPWGSPWTTTDYSPPKIDLPAPPPNAHFSSSADPSPKRLTPARTPWDDDDAWGGWNDAGKESPRWGRSPGLRPLDVSGSGPATRLPSPAPSPGAWDQLATLEVARVRKDERHGDSAISLPDGIRRETSRERYLSSTRLSVSSKRSTEDIWKRADAGVSSDSLGVPVREPIQRPDSPDQEPPGPAIHVDTDSRSSRRSSKVQELVVMYDGMAKHSRDSSPIEPTLRKTSSAASPLSNGGLDPSLATMSAEPEPLDLGSLEIPDETQSKEDEEKEDELPKREPFAAERPSVDQANLTVEPESEVISTLPASTDEAKVVSHVSLDQGNMSHDGESPKEKEQPSTLDDIELSDPQPVIDDSLEPPLPKIEPPADPYSIDMSKIDELFPNVETSFPSPEPVPDVIIDDTFAASSERKAWYLMSRFGSIRKHNSGDDDDYVRISWAKSSVRDQAIRIVRRWMEEDSITGRVVLGRRTGPAGAKIFNWDSSAPPVEISELLGRKSHSRHASVNSKGTVNSPIVPAFGWSNTPITSPTVPLHPPPPSQTSVRTGPSSTEKSASTAGIPKLQPIGQLPSASQSLASPKSPLAMPPRTSSSDDVECDRPRAGDEKTDGESEDKVDDEDEDDDDWGEMVSSPTVATNGGFSSLDGAMKNETMVNGTDISGFSESITTLNGFSEGVSKAASAAADWTGVAHSSFDIPASRGFLPPSLSKSSTASWTDMNRSSIDASASQGFLPPSLSKSSTASWTGLSRSSLDGGLSEELIQNRAMSPLKEKSRPNSWAFGTVNFLDGAPKAPPKPAPPMIKTIHTHTRQRSLLSKPPMVTDNDSPIERLSSSILRHPPPLSLKPHTSKDDETVANVLRDLPDLSYMLR